MTKKFKYGIVTEKVGLFTGECSVPVIDVFHTKKQRDAEYVRLIKHCKMLKLRANIHKTKICETTFVREQ